MYEHARCVALNTRAALLAIPRSRGGCEPSRGQWQLVLALQKPPSGIASSLPRIWSLHRLEALQRCCRRVVQIGDLPWETANYPEGLVEQIYGGEG